jgi:polysaccharide biosynthesis protein PslA
MSVIISGIFAWSVYSTLPGVSIVLWPDYAVALGVSAPLAVFIFRAAGSYSPLARRSSWQAQARIAVFGLLCFGAILLCLVFYTKMSEIYSRGWVTAWFGFLAAMTLGVRALYSWIDGNNEISASFADRVAVVGAGEIGEHVFALLAAGGEHRVNVVGIFDQRCTRQAKRIEEHVRGTIKDLILMASRFELDAIIVAIPWGAERRLDDIVQQLRVLSVDVFVLPGSAPARYLTSPLYQLGNMPVIGLIARPLDDVCHIIKLFEDKILSLLIGILAAPMLAVIMVAIKLDSPGPILFRQTRRGFHHNLFTMYKFRTMHHVETDLLGDRLTERNDKRVTRVGWWLRRLSLDEFPQLINVLRGDMSLVGPRPHAINSKAADYLYEDAVVEYAYRYRVRPGITGWAQINGWRGGTETVEKLQKRVDYDLYYIDNWSVALDLKILCLTALRGFWHENAY